MEPMRRDFSMVFNSLGGAPSEQYTVTRMISVPTCAALLEILLLLCRTVPAFSCVLVGATKG